MSKINAPKGFADTLPIDAWKWQSIERIARATATAYNFAEIRTPILEYSDLFHRGVGETTDIVTKETFSFTDRGGDSLTMRPEGTAGVVRAVIEAGLLNDQGSRVKVFYIGPNFRYERPQKGRLRQHHQFGVEAFGVAEPEQDVECILLQMAFYKAAGLKDLALRLNSLGDSESKAKYRDALVTFLEPKKSQLSKESLTRLEKNPLRILDSKDPGDLAAVAGAPPAGEYLSETSRTHFETVKAMLSDAEAIFKVDGGLVRGFDYYSGTLWEVTAGGLGSQSAVGGGGRYDNLAEHLGARPTPGVGFGSGLERLIIALEAQGVAIPESRSKLIYLIHDGDAAKAANVTLLRDLRAAGVRADMDLSSRSVKNQLKVAERDGATIVAITSDNELAAGTVNKKRVVTSEGITFIEREQAVMSRQAFIEEMRGSS